MKTTTTIKQTLLALTIALSIASCKKDKKEDPALPPVEVKAITLTELKALSTGASVKVPDAKKITGIVISDVSSKNIDSKTVILQEAAGQTGIIVTFDAAQTFATGDQVEVDISGQTLAQVNGEIELTNVPAAKAKKTGTGTITAKATTAADIATNKAAWDGTLVTIAATELTGTTAKYSGTLTIKDASGTVTSAILAGASFETTDLPPSVSSVTGIVRVGTNANGVANARLDIRKPADVVTGAVTRIVTEMFENVTAYAVTASDPSHIQQFGFTTNVGAWGTNTSTVMAFITPGSTYDADFTTAGRSYIYLSQSDRDPVTGESTTPIEHSQSNFVLPCSNTNLKGLKTVSVTFAASKGSDFSFRQWASKTKFFDQIFNAPFNESTDYAQIGIGAIGALDYGLSVGDETFLTKSTQYKKAGVFYTFTWTVPTKEQLVAGGLNSDKADLYLENPNFCIYNLSKIAGATPYKRYAPILLDKVVLGFTN